MEKKHFWLLLKGKLQLTSQDSFEIPRAISLTGPYSSSSINGNSEQNFSVSETVCHCDSVRVKVTRFLWGYRYFSLTSPTCLFHENPGSLFFIDVQLRTMLTNKILWLPCLCEMGNLTKSNKYNKKDPLIC